MIAKRHFFRRGYGRIFALASTFLLVGSSLFAAEQAGTSESIYMIFSLESISVEQGKEYLAGVGIRDISHFPGLSALLVTGPPSKLAKAKTVLELVDGPEQFIIKEVLPVSKLRNVPSNEQIAASLGDISIGNFSNPPAGNKSTKAIIDIQNDVLVAIAPVSLLEKIVYAIMQLSNSGKLKAQDKPIAQDELKAQAEGKATELAEPNESKSISAANSKIEIKLNDIAALLEQKASERKVPEQKMPVQKMPVPADANQPYEPADIPNGNEIVNLALTDFEKLTIVEFLGLVGPYLQLDFMYDAKELVGEVTFNPHGKFRGPIKVKDLYPLLETVLKFKGFAMTRGKGNLVTIVPEARALNIDPALLEVDKDKVEHGDGIVTRIFNLKHIDTASAQNLLTGMQLTTSITPIAETKTLIITGYAYRMPRIKALIDIVDKPGEPKKFRFRQLQYTMAQTLAPKLQTLAEQLGTVSITIATTTAAPTTISPRDPRETEAQYQLRLRREAEARRRAITAPQAITPAEAGKPTVYLDADERTNRILMIGLDEQLDDVEELINTLDVAQKDLRTLKLYKIEHVDAEEVRKKLEELGIIGASLTTPSMRITDTTKPAPTQTSITRTSTATRTRAGIETTEAPIEEPQVVVVEPTNSLLVNATAEQHVQIAEILSYVDSQTEIEEIPYKLYPLENQSPEHMAEVLMKLIEETVLDKESKVEKVVKRQDEQIYIVPDPNTFSLIVYASKKNQEWIENLIKQLDQRRPQVLIDVTLVEISEVDAFDYDLQLVRKIPRFEPGGQMDKLPALLAPEGIGFPSERVAEVTSILGEGLAGRGFYADSHIQALLSLMQKKGYGRVLAKPKILVNDNEQGHIDTKNTIYVSRSSQAVTTTGEATLSTSFTFDEFPSGIELDITPHISKGNLLRLDILMTRSSQPAPEGGIAQNEPPPAKSENNIQTIVTVPDKSTIILGGIITLEQTKDNWKVPLLGDIPVLGGFFRKIDNSSRHSKLYIFVKADILRPDEKVTGLPDLERISEENRNAFETFEDRFQNHQDWPGISPKVMEPFKVLDAR